MESAIYDRLRVHLAARRTAVVVSVIAGPGMGSQMLFTTGQDAETVGGFADPAIDRAARDAAAEAMTGFRPRRCDVEADEGRVTLFVDVYPPRRTLVVVGGVHLAIPLVAFAHTLGLRTVVVDPRTAFLTRERFPDVDVMSHEWPDVAFATIGLDDATYVATLSHDEKLDVPALASALKSPARYIGALGSRKTHAKRVAQLRELGFGDDELLRIHSPIGVPLGGRKAEEIAVSILAEIVAVDNRARDVL